MSKKNKENTSQLHLDFSFTNNESAVEKKGIENCIKPNYNRVISFIPSQYLSDKELYARILNRKMQ